MAGVPVRALSAPTLWLVLRGTSFGHVWLARFALVAVLAIILVLRRLFARRTHAIAVDAIATLVAVAAIAALAASGHAVAETGADKVVHIGADALHLIATGAWLGALVPLAMALRATGDPARANVLARRFSDVGIASVSLLIATGIVNGVYLVGTWPALFGTRYGILLLAKIALLAVMVLLAATNRLRWRPQLAGGVLPAATASARIAGNARVEAALGAGILAIVGVLGVSTPAAHDTTSWPFPFRVVFDEGRWPSIAPAYPTTYVRPALRYTVSSIARGSVVYAAQCASCHGTEGHGDGPMARDLATKPADLAAGHVADHRDGDLYWWITHGIAGTPMPGFGASLDDVARWDLVNFVKAIAGSTRLQVSGTPPGEVDAPEFTYQVDKGPQKSIPAEDSATLLVLYTLPLSRDRMLALSTVTTDLARAGVRVAAVPLSDDSSTASDSRIATIAASASPGLREAYELFARDVPRRDRGHLEFLIDREGWLRARWDAGNVLDPTALAQQIRLMETQKGPAVRRAKHAQAH